VGLAEILPEVNIADDEAAAERDAAAAAMELVIAT
jgi:hypothetical protein